MTRPTVTETTEELYSAVREVAGPDESIDAANGYVTLRLLASVGDQADPIADVVHDSDDGPGWSAVLDVDRCPGWALPWLGQFVGVRIPEGMSDDDARALIASHPQWLRGTPAKFTTDAKATLTGPQLIHFYERYQGDPYKVAVVTYTPQTPDPDATQAALAAQKPVGLILAYECLTGMDWIDLRTTTQTWAQLRTAGTTWTQLRTIVPTI